MSAARNAITRRRLLAAIFSKAARLGIGSDELRESIAPSVIGRRLSEADNRDLFRVIEHLAGLAPSGQHEGTKRHAQSLMGLREEIEDLAHERYGDEFEAPLNALCRRFGVEHYRWLDLRHAKAVKRRLREMNAASRGENR